MAINLVTNKQLGITLWIHFQNGFTSLVNNDVKDFSSLEAMVDSTGAAAREVRFALQPARPVSNAQMRDPGAQNGVFISGDADTIVEKSATAKQLDVVAEFDYDVYMRAENDPSQVYVGPMGMAVDNLIFNAKESLLVQYYNDGSGVQAQLSSTPVLTVVAALDGTNAGLSFVIGNTSAYAGSIYNVRESQKLVAYTAAGAAHQPTVTSGTPAYLKVYSIVNVGTTKTISVLAYDASDNVLNITAASAVAASDVLYNYSDVANGGIAGNLSAISDWGSLLYMPGLRSLGAADGRVVNGVTLSGAYAGTETDLAGASLFFTDFGKLFAKIQRRTAEGKYDYPMLKCSFDTYNYLINLDEGSKYLKAVNEVDQNGRGVKKYMYYYNDIAAEVCGRRFVADSDIWAEPKLMDSMSVPGVTKEGPIMFKFTGFDYVKEPGNNDIFRFKITSAGRIKVVQTHMQTFGTFVATQSAAIGHIKNFIIS